MPKTPARIKPNYSPVYAAALYPDLAAICIKHGYALAVHWVAQTSPPEEVLKEITETFCIQAIGEPEKKGDRRIAYSIGVGFGECCLDFSFILDDVNYACWEKFKS